MADVRPFRALHYAPGVDLATAVCPPFDVIPPQLQRELHRINPHNAVRLELAEDGRDPYRRAAGTLDEWLRKGVLLRDQAPAFHLYREEFRHNGRTYRRRVLLARLRLEPWERGVVLPHERTFGAPKEDRLKLLRAIRMNTSPVYLLYRDAQQQIAPLLSRVAGAKPSLQFQDEGLSYDLWQLKEAAMLSPLSHAFQRETLYVADGHHRYETALAYRDECRAEAKAWTGDEPENFALVALTAADDPGLLVLPIHRLANVNVPAEQVLERLRPAFTVDTMPDAAALLAAMAKRSDRMTVLGLAAGKPLALHLLTLVDPDAVAGLLPPEPSAVWRRLDVTIANHAVLRHALALTDDQMSDIDTLSFSEDAQEAIEAVRKGFSRYALLLNPVPVGRILAVADASERMPQKSTFFYPKVPTGLVFNPLDD